MRGRPRRGNNRSAFDLDAAGIGTGHRLGGIESGGAS